MFETIDEAVRVTRNFIERAVPRQFCVTHDGQRVVVMRSKQCAKIDLYGLLAMRDRQGLLARVIFRLRTAQAAGKL